MFLIRENLTKEYTEAVWKESLLDSPLSSLIVIGRSSIILANATGQSILKLSLKLLNKFNYAKP